MAKQSKRIDEFVEALKRVDDEHLASLSHSPAAEALYEEVSSMSVSDQQTGVAEQAGGTGSGGRAKKTNRRRRLMWEGAVVAAAVVVVLAVLSVVNVFGAGGPSIVEKAAAALDPSANAIIHVKISGNESDEGGYTSTWTEESWARTASPYSRRDIQAYAGSPVVETAQDSSGLVQSYDAATNTIYQPAQGGGFTVAPGQSDPYRDMILELLNSGDAVVEGNDNIAGRKVIRIVATKDYGSAPDGTRYGTWYYVDPDTKNPVEWKMTRDGGKVVDIHFDVYEQLPATDDNLALLDLGAQHPGATVNSSQQDYQDFLDLPAPTASGDPSSKK
jgi:hypothetical protein